MGCTNSKVCPLPMGLAVETLKTPRQKRSRISFVARMKMLKQEEEVRGPEGATCDPTFGCHFVLWYPFFQKNDVPKKKTHLDYVFYPPI